MWYVYTMVYYSVLKNNNIVKFAGKWMELEKNNPEWGNRDPERQTQYVLTHKWKLDVKQKTIRLLSTAAEKLGNTEDINRNTWIVSGRQRRWDLLCKLRVGR